MTLGRSLDTFFAGVAIVSGCRPRPDPDAQRGTTSQPRYGELMSAVGHRFELAEFVPKLDPVP